MTEGAALLEAAHQPATAVKYVNGWERFAEFCAKARLCPLPAAPETLVRSVGHVKALGTVAARSLGNRLAPIAAVHALEGHHSPTQDSVVKQAKQNYARTHTVEAGGRPKLRGPLPAAAVDAFLGLWPKAPPDLRCEIAGLSLAYLLLNRPGAASHMRALDVFPTRRGLQVQVPDYKMAVLKNGDRIAYTVPTAAGGWRSDRPLRIIRAHWRAHVAAGRPHNERLFGRAPLWPGLHGPGLACGRRHPLDAGPPRACADAGPAGYQVVGPLSAGRRGDGGACAGVAQCADPPADGAVGRQGGVPPLHQRHLGGVVGSLELVWALRAPGAARLAASISDFMAHTPRYPGYAHFPLPGQGC